jgi:hypothetical protein
MPLVSARARKEASDGILVALAGGQHGVVARRQLIAAGVGAGAITERLASGLLVPLHRGVYAVGKAFVERLESAADEEVEDSPPVRLPSPDAIANDFQRFLRQRGPGEGA